MNAYIYVIRPTRLGMVTDEPTAAEQSALERHFEYLQNLAEQGIALHVGRSTNEDENIFGLVIFRAESVGDAQKIMNTDPAIKEGIMTGDVFPYKAVLGFSAP
ncbi:YciI family protein [Porticoccaceae bacterium LTM1]|nr:YciI family protein [Porticoccaceae bacterium LTM1]